MSTTSNGPGRLARVCRLAAAALVVAGLAACADSPSAPAIGAAATPALARASAPGQQGRFGTSDVLASPVVAQGLLRTTALPAPVVVTKELTRSGARFTVPGTGLTVQVPAGAIPDGSLTITVTAPAGDLVAYEFEPHGTVFRKPLQLTQELRGTNWQRKLAPRLDVGYFAAHGDLDPRRRTALVREALPAGFDVNGQHIDFDVWHFSGYMVSWGFSDRGDRDCWW